ncbi:hypothetical protein [Natronomonas sp.]|uniref:hypothetical protein n=1 Tax=Natronomonas sp. TaxID=2184060 RepID=UPI002636D4DC|nr:hypothetical protein [Natronomonas sp.]
MLYIVWSDRVADDGDVAFRISAKPYKHLKGVVGGDDGTSGDGTDGQTNGIEDQPGLGIGTAAAALGGAGHLWKRGSGGGSESGSGGRGGADGA